MSNAPVWIRQLVESVSAQFTALNSAAEVGCHIFHNNSDGCDEWEVTVFGEPVEMGGRLAGHSLHPVFSVDTLAVVTLFDALASCRWQSGRIDGDDDLGPHLSVEGDVMGRQVWLRIVGRKPESITSTTAPTQVRQK